MRFFDSKVGILQSLPNFFLRRKTNYAIILFIYILKSGFQLLISPFYKLFLYKIIDLHCKNDPRMKGCKGERFVQVNVHHMQF
jgi:hypothetical protein